MVRTLSASMILLVTVAAAQEAGGIVEWSTDLTAAFAKAKEVQKILMICVNAKQVEGSAREEPAAKGLREVVYKDPRVVAKSREFVCALIGPGSSSTEFGELRLLGIEGMLISPQHIFVHPDGKSILVRKQYWSHGSGEEGVKALLALMEEAKAKLAGGGESPKEEAAAPVEAAPEGDARAAWIAARIREVVEGPAATRTAAIDALVRNDKEGDCTTPLLALLEEHRKETPLLVELVRALGRDQLLVAAGPVADLLGHKEDAVRGNAAVSLEYIGSHDKDVVAALMKQAGRERDEAIANHLFRALGRCGVGDARVRSLLLKKCEGAKSEFASYGPAIGLAYFEGDRKAARGVEKMLKKIGVPGGRRGGGEGGVKRGVLSWTLASIGDWESGAFVREELLAKLENMKAFWVGPLKSFYGLVAKKCDGDPSAMAGIEEGVRGIVGFTKGAGGEVGTLIDDYRKDRPAGPFTPRGEYLLGMGGDT